MHGLTIRWSLTGAPEGVEDALRAHPPERFVALACLDDHEPTRLQRTGHLAPERGRIVDHEHTERLGRWIHEQRQGCR